MKDNRMNFVCTKCGMCCCGFSENNGVILFPKDIKRIANKLNIPLQSFKTKYCYSRELITEKKTLTLFFLRHISGRCIFLNDFNLCIIYDFKPIQCTKGPFYFFWKEGECFNFECMKNVKVPENWSTYDDDFELIAALFNDQI
jgi:Fe-S-cluster containining protein